MDVAVVANQPATLPSATDVIGCLVAPIPIVAVVVAESILYTRFNAITVLIFSLIAYVVALGLTLLPGYALYCLLVKFNVFRWWTSILSGSAIGAIATILIAHPANVMSSGVLINSLTAATSGLLFWIIQRGKRNTTKNSD